MPAQWEVCDLARAIEMGFSVLKNEMPERSNPFDSLPIEAMAAHSQSPQGATIETMKQSVDVALDALKKERSGLGIYGAFPDFSISRSQQRIRAICQELLRCCDDGGMM
jgi:hypothetical protein